MLNCFEREKVQREIEWLRNKIASLEIKARRKPSAVREINDLNRQIREREITLAFGEYAGRK